MSSRILVINPGAGSTRIALFEDDRSVFDENIRHAQEELSRCQSIIDQYQFRKETVVKVLADRKIDLGNIAAVVGRGGPFKPLVSGTYRVNDKLIDDIKQGNYQSEHPSLLGALIAKEIGDSIGKPSYFVDPVSVDEFWPLARLSGLKEIPRKALSHALNVRMVAKKAAAELKKPYAECNFVIVHLGTGITVAVHHKGQQIDSSNANEDGPFSPQRAGALPTIPLVEMCFKGQHTAADIKKIINRKGGMLSYLSTDDITEIEKRIDSGDQEAKLAYDAMIYQIAKEVGAYSVVLRGQLDAIIITGGIAHSQRFVSQLRGWIGFLAPQFFIYPGEGEMEALALGVLRVLNGEEEVKKYR